MQSFPDCQDNPTTYQPEPIDFSTFDLFDAFRAQEPFADSNLYDFKVLSGQGLRHDEYSIYVDDGIVENIKQGNTNELQQEYEHQTSQDNVLNLFDMSEEVPSNLDAACVGISKDLFLVPTDQLHQGSRTIESNHLGTSN